LCQSRQVSWDCHTTMSARDPIYGAGLERGGAWGNGGADAGDGCRMAHSVRSAWPTAPLSLQWSTIHPPKLAVVITAAHPHRNQAGSLDRMTTAVTAAAAASVSGAGSGTGRHQNSPAGWAGIAAISQRRAAVPTWDKVAPSDPALPWRAAAHVTTRR
jgi:hypothetical protein